LSLPGPFVRLVLSAAALALLSPEATAADAESPKLTLELNALEEADGGCLLSFVAQNENAADIDAAVFETVLFNRQGQVSRLTLFDFGALPAGRPRVRQFVVPDLACADLGRVLINGASTCEAGELGASACSDGLSFSSRTDVEILG